MDSEKSQILLAGSLAASVLLIVIGYFIWSLIKHQKNYIRISQRNILAELSLLERDRMRVAADLHDELSPLLTAVKFQVDSIQPMDEDDRQTIITSKHQIDMLAQRMREISRDLMPASLTRKGLIAALNDYFSMIRKGNGMKIIFRHETSVELPEEKRINCYRIIQEITHNTIKHAAATEYLVQLTEEKGVLKLVCEDNGRGFDYESTLASAAGMGLRNITSRAALITSDFRVTSIKGRGTQYTFDIPLT